MFGKVVLLMIASPMSLPYYGTLPDGGCCSGLALTTTLTMARMIYSFSLNQELVSG
jgi:hypothetical protein